MFIKPFIILIFTLKNYFCSCHKEIAKSNFKNGKRLIEAKKIGNLNSLINESSGLIAAEDSNNFYTINDGGGKAEIYEVNKKGDLISTRTVANTSNYDWEEITKDTKGNLFIGDFGNNNNNRKDLKIYKLNKGTNIIDTISFSFQDQTEFPPPKSKKNFDCEAFFWLQDTLILFSKNRGIKSVKIYKIPAKPGNYTAHVSQTIFFNTMITGACYNTETKICTLLGYGKLYFLKVEQFPSIYFKPYICKKFAKSQQAEAIANSSDKLIYVTNEQGKIFQITIDDSVY